MGRTALFSIIWTFIFALLYGWFESNGWEFLKILALIMIVLSLGTLIRSIFKI
jgi:hypothetical protein